MRLDFGISEGFRQELEIGWGEAISGDDHDTVSGTPRTISPHPARTHHAVLQKQTLLRRGLGFRGVGELLPRGAGIFVFYVLKMLRFHFRDEQQGSKANLEMNKSLARSLVVQDSRIGREVIQTAHLWAKDPLPFPELGTPAGCTIAERHEDPLRVEAWDYRQTPRGTAWPHRALCSWVGWPLFACVFSARFVRIILVSGTRVTAVLSLGARFAQVVASPLQGSRGVFISGPR